MVLKILIEIIVVVYLVQERLCADPLRRPKMTKRAAHQPKTALISEKIPCC